MKHPQDDLTVIYVTANLLPEKFVNFQRGVLLGAIGRAKLIISSMQPTEFGGGINILQTTPKSHLNMYKQMLKAAKMATTRYIATAEDDVLYSEDHFTYMRPKANEVAYNMSRWSLFTWNPVYSVKNRINNSTMIAPRDYWIEAWEERLKKFPEDFPIHRISEIGRNNQEEWMGVSKRNMVKFWSGIPVIDINHDFGTDTVANQHTKKLGEHRALDIPYWGRADKITELFK